MASSSYFFFVTNLWVSVNLIFPLRCFAENYFFVFGDSLYDPGNNIYISPATYMPSYHPPYGTTFFNHSTGRFSDGRVVPDFIAVNMNLPFIPPILDPNEDFTNGANFASGGAGVFEGSNNVMSFGEQVNKFEGLAANWTAKIGSDNSYTRFASAVYLISIGGNDYFSYVTKYPNASVDEQMKFVDSVFGNFTSMIKKIYEVGGRKFMFQNVSPIGCLPMTKQNYNLSIGGACDGKSLTLARLHNSALPKALEELRSNLTGFIYSIFDYHTSVGDRINNPTEYGFKGGDVSCCGIGSHRAENCGAEYDDFELCFDPNEFVFFDGQHNTEHANYQLADLMWNGGSNAVAPYTMKQLFEL